MNDSRKWDGMEGGCGRIESQGVWVVFLKKNNVKHVLIISRLNRHGSSPDLVQFLVGLCWRSCSIFSSIGCVRGAKQWKQWKQFHSLVVKRGRGGRGVIPGMRSAPSVSARLLKTCIFRCQSSWNFTVMFVQMQSPYVQNLGSFRADLAILW